ncbi:MAG: hypothetical protein JWL95_3316, partial [Gemmatimonadetes bacterium]|nr:hypothetical protein [Gemmatimonadota bacterium]
DGADSTSHSEAAGTAWQDSPSAGYGGEQAVTLSHDAPDMIDLDLTAPHGVPVVANHAPPPVDLPFEALSLGGIVPMSETAEPMPEVEARAHGFEATEFSAPEAPIEQTAGLQSAFEDETGIYGAAVAPLDGLDTPQHQADGPYGSPTSELPALDEDEGMVLPPHGDPVVATSNAPVTSDSFSDFEPLESEFELPSTSSSPSERFDAGAAFAPADASGDSLEFDMPGDSEQPTPDASPAGSALPLELPPEVIAAEAELIDTGMSMEQLTERDATDEDETESESAGSELTFLDTEAPNAAAESAPVDEEELAEATEPPPAAHRPFVTETMAELYLKQGFREQALAVYQQLSDSSPSDARLSHMVASLRAAAAAPTPVDAGPTVRDFFAHLAARRPGERNAGSVPPSESDFALGEPVPAAIDSAVGAEIAPGGVAERSEPAPFSSGDASAHPTGGTIDALFGNRPIGTSEDSAASALAQAFGASSNAPSISGRPARQASGELSLDSVFRDGGSRGPRSSQGFSFDQFFSQNAEGEETSSGRTSQEIPMPGEPAEKSADDIEQFNSWLQGLKNR